MQTCRPWCRHFLTNFLNLSRAAPTVSFTSCLNVTILLLYWAFLFGEKYFVIRNFWANSSHVVIEYGGNESSHASMLPYKEKGNSFNLSVSLDTPIILKELQIRRRSFKCLCGSSLGSLENYPTVWNIWNIMGFNSKCVASTVGSLMPGLKF